MALGGRLDGGSWIGKTVTLAAPPGGLEPAVLPIKTAASGGAQEITGVGQIASAEAVGQPTVVPVVDVAGIVSAQAIGQPAVSAVIAAAGIPTAEALGQPSLVPEIASIGIATAENSGTPELHAVITALGTPSASAPGLPDISAVVESAGIETAEAIGQPAVDDQTSPHEIQGVGGIASQEAGGTPIVASVAVPVAGQTGGGRFIPGKRYRPEIIIEPAPHVVGDVGGIPTAEAVGRPRITPGPWRRPRQTREEEYLFRRAA